MIRKFCVARTAIAFIACGMSLLAQAQITKCVDAEGKISYTNNACVNASAVAYIAVDEAPASGAAAVQPSDAAPASQALNAMPLHASAWAQRPSLPGSKSLDAQTVREARQALAAVDRAVASLRTTKIASNN